MHIRLNKKNSQIFFASKIYPVYVNESISSKELTAPSSSVKNCTNNARDILKIFV